MKGNTNLEELDGSSSFGGLVAHKRSFITRSVVSMLIQCHLKTLLLSGNQLGDEELRQLALAAEGTGLSRTLTLLHLGNNNISDDGCRSLVNALRENESLEMLDLADNKIGMKGCAALADLLGGTFYAGVDGKSDDRSRCPLTCLILAGNPIGDDGLTALCYGSSSGGPSEAAPKEPAGLVCTKTLSRLFLERTQVGDAGCCSLASVLRKNGALTLVNIRRNERITAGPGGGAMALKESLVCSNYTLEHLYLCDPIDTSASTAESALKVITPMQAVARDIDTECLKNRNLKRTMQLLQMFQQIIPLEQWCDALVLFTSRPDLIYQTLRMKPEVVCPCRTKDKNGNSM